MTDARAPLIITEKPQGYPCACAYRRGYKDTFHSPAFAPHALCLPAGSEPLAGARNPQGDRVHAGRTLGSGHFSFTATESKHVFLSRCSQLGSVYFPTLTSVDVSAHVKTEPVLTYSIARVRICLGLHLHTLRSGGASAAAVHTLLVLHRSGASTGNFAAPSARPTAMIFVNVFTTKNAARRQF